MSNASIDFIPSTPIISRFVAPWDTSGWYYAQPHLTVGSKMYSNADVHISSLPDEYYGAEYIVTYDSKSEDFDDKQEVNFFVECDASVYIALDNSAPANLFAEFHPTQTTLSATNGCTYNILIKNHKAGEQVHIPGFSGDYHHFIVFAKPANSTVHSLQNIAPMPTQSTLPSYNSRPYSWYLYTVFNRVVDGTTPPELSYTGNCTVKRYPYSLQRKYLCLRQDSSVNYTALTSGEDIFETSLELLCGTAFVTFCGISLTFRHGCLTLANGHSIGDDIGSSIQLKFVRSNSTCQVWLNSRLVATVACSCFDDASFTVSTSIASSVAIDLLSLKDNPDILVLDEKFDTLSSSIIYASDTSAIIADYPFATNKSLCITGSNTPTHTVYPFNFVTGNTVSLETRVKALSDDFTLLPEIRDQSGNVALRIAMYKNSLYASYGNAWQRIFGNSTNWQYYPHNNWYHIKVTINIAQAIYTLFVDGAQRASLFPLANPVQNIAQAAFYSHSHTLYVNSLIVYDAATRGRSLLPPTPVYDVTKPPYNAKGDGTTLDTKAIQHAINDAAYTGGTVYLQEGTFFTGALRLCSDITFFVDETATLLGSQDHSHYPLFTPGESLCAWRQLGRGLLYGENLCNVRITGGGTIDGNGLYRFKMNDPEDRELDARPDLIYVAYSNGITIDNLNLKSSAFWSVVPLSCQNVVMEYLNLDCMNTPNRDGIDPVDCVDVTIRSCSIMAGDDGLCFKSSDAFGCKNIDVDDMMIQSLASGIKFGTDTYYCFKNAKIQNCFVKNVNRCGISLEAVDGAKVEDTVFHNIDINDVGAAVYIVIGDRQRLPRGNHPVRKGQIQNVQFNNIRFANPYQFSYAKNLHECMIVGQSSEQTIRNISFSQCSFALPGGSPVSHPAPNPIDAGYPEYDRHGALSSGHAFTVRYASNVTFNSVAITLDTPDVRPAIAYFDYEESSSTP